MNNSFNSTKVITGVNTRWSYCNVWDQTTPNMIQRISGVFERKPLILMEI